MVDQKLFSKSLKMTQNISSAFRNNLSKCLFNDRGFCKFKEGCRKQHFSSICPRPKENCDENCLDRHPKQCKFKDGCKFLKKKVCAFSHASVAQDDKTIELIKLLDVQVKELKQLFEDNKVASESKMKSLNDEIFTLKKEKSENMISKTELVDKNEILERYVKKEVKTLHQKIDKIKHVSENLETNLDNKTEEQNEKLNKVISKVDSLERVAEQNLNKKSEEENIELIVSKHKNKPKLSKSKIKELLEANIIKGFEKDCKVMFELRMNCGLDVKSQKCKKCEFQTHSEGLLRRHKETEHNLKQTMVNLILGFECDIEKHVEVLKTMGEEEETIKCDQCEYKTHSEGRLIIHENNTHQKH